MSTPKFTQASGSRPNTLAFTHWSAPVRVAMPMPPGAEEQRHGLVGLLRFSQDGRRRGVDESLACDPIASNCSRFVSTAHAKRRSRNNEKFATRK